jgi:sigma-E factor negative regulatory protein RseC
MESDKWTLKRASLYSNVHFLWIRFWRALLGDDYVARCVESEVMPISASKTFIERQARVVGYHDKGIVVEVTASSGCTQCAKGQGCGAGLLSRPRAWQLEIEVPTYPEGDAVPPLNSEVTVAMPKASMTQLTGLIYGLPLLMGLVVAAIGSVVSDSTWLAPGLFFGVLMCGMVGLKYALGQRAEFFRPQLIDAP